MISKDYLLDENYYIKLLPMLLRDSYGFKEQLTCYVKLFQQMDFVCDQYINSLDLYNILWGVKKNKDGTYKLNNPWKVKDKDGKLITFENYEQFLEWFGETPFIILDFIASLVGINRTVVYEYETIDEHEVKIINRQTITLTNKELYHYILIAIARNNYDGTREMLDNVYNKTFVESGIIQSINYKKEGNCQVLVRIVYNTSISDNEKILFQSGNYLIKSLGIDYSINMVESEENIFKLGISKMDDIKYQI